MLGKWMQAEIEEQPALLHQESSAYAGQLDFLLGQNYEMVTFVARGSSDHAALYGRYLVEIELQIPATLSAPSVLTRYRKHVEYPSALAIGISQSGAAPDVAEVLGYMTSQRHQTLAITNTEGSRVTEEAAHSLLLGVGKEQSVAATKTYTASLLAVYEVVRALGAPLRAPDELLPAKKWLDRARTHAEADAQEVVAAKGPVFALARGYAFATARETALKLMECALIPCQAYSFADFEHGPKALASAGSVAIVYGESGKPLASQGAKVLYAPDPPAEVPEALTPIWEIKYGQYLALNCARLRGLDPDNPQFIQKVTETF